VINALLIEFDKLIMLEVVFEAVFEVEVKFDGLIYFEVVFEVEVVFVVGVVFKE
jgi:hypothetical protein